VPVLFAQIFERLLKTFIFVAGRELKMSGLLRPLQVSSFALNITKVYFFFFLFWLSPGEMETAKVGAQ
jgi:hypothetical protein